MPYLKIEPSGCVAYKGLVQILFSMYLNPTDYGYEKHHVQTVDEFGVPTGAWQDNPFHNHFILVDPDALDADLLNRAVEVLQQAYNAWAMEWQINIKNPAILNFPSFSPAQLKKVEKRLAYLIANSTSFEVQL